jgi:hypothetical protein
MSEGRGWPDPTKPGVPASPDEPNPHLILGEDGKRRWVWWEPGRNGSRGGWLFTGGCGPITAWVYLGQAVAPDHGGGVPVGGLAGESRGTMASAGHRCVTPAGESRSDLATRCIDVTDRAREG